MKRAEIFTAGTAWPDGIDRHPGDRFCRSSDVCCQSVHKQKCCGHAGISYGGHDLSG